jgi:hypothetical protein
VRWWSLPRLLLSHKQSPQTEQSDVEASACLNDAAWLKCSIWSNNHAANGCHSWSHCTNCEIGQECTRRSGIDKISTDRAACLMQLPARSSLQSAVDDVTVTLTRTLKYSSIGRRKLQVELCCQVGVSVLSVRWQCHQSWVHLALSLTAFKPGPLPDCANRRCDPHCCHCRNARMLLSPVMHPYKKDLQFDVM